MSSPSVEDMRYAVMNVYPGHKWSNKVRDMSDNQIIAVYYDFLHRGKFDKKTKKSNDDYSKKKHFNKKDYSYEQLTIYGDWERR